MTYLYIYFGIGFAHMLLSLGWIRETAANPVIACAFTWVVWPLTIYWQLTEKMNPTK